MQENHLGLINYYQIPRTDWLEVVIIIMGTFRKRKGWISQLWQSYSFGFDYQRMRNKRSLKYIVKYIETRTSTYFETLDRPETKSMGYFLWEYVHTSIYFFHMNINLQLKIKMSKKDIHQGSKHLRMPRTNLKTIKFNNIWLKTKTFLLK